jgi:hypothetical protein
MAASSHKYDFNESQQFRMRLLETSEEKEQKKM